MEKMNELVDIDNKELQIGHIVAVRYSWNSYIGEVSLLGLISTGAERFSFFSPHSLKPEHTYQIIGHSSKSSPDYNDQVREWYHSGKGDCPVKLRIYDNL